MPTFNSCTKCVCSPGRLYDRTPDFPQIFLSIDVYMTSQPILALICKLRVSSMCLAYFLTCHLWMFVQPGTARRLVDRCRN